jgi:predicted Zn-dependent peptidase
MRINQLISLILFMFCTEILFLGASAALCNEEPLQVPHFEHALLKNGLEVIVDENHRHPLVQVEFVTRMGSAADPKTKGGTAFLSYQLLIEATEVQDSGELSKRVAALGTHIESQVDFDGGAVSMPLQRKDLDAGLLLLADIIKHPRFEESDFNRIKSKHKRFLSATQNSAGNLAMDEFLQRIYGPAHPYGHPAKGTIASIDSITIEDVKQQWARSLSSTNSALVFSGDITLKEAVSAAKKYLGDLTAQHELLTSEGVPKSRALSLTLISKPESPKTSIILGRPWPIKGRTDNSAYVVLNELMTGTLTNRLRTNLENAAPQSRKVDSTFYALRYPGPMFVRADIQIPYAAPALQEIFLTLEALKKHLVGFEEFERARSILGKSLSVSLETIASRASLMRTLFVYDLPMDYYARWQKSVERVSREDVQLAAQKILDIASFSAVLVGNLDLMEKPIRKLELGKILVKRKDAQQPKKMKDN